MSNNMPPKWSLAFFRWYCRPDYAEDIEGDLLERYDKWKIEGKRADWLFSKEVVKLFRPGLIKKFEGTQKLNYYGMFKHNLKISYRNLIRQKANTFINVGGLALGLTITILIALWIRAELTFNTNHKNYDRIAQVLQNQTINGVTETGYAIPYPLGEELQTAYGSNFDQIVMSSWFGDYVLSHESTAVSRKGGFMDVGAPHLLSLEMVTGTRDGLQDPNSILLSESSAKALFGEKDPTGQMVRIYNEVSVIVTGVYKDIPASSSFSVLTFIAPWELYVSEQDWVQLARDRKIWNDNSFQLFVQINPKAIMDEVSETIKLAKYNNVKEENKIFKAEVFLHPMQDWHLRSTWDNGVKRGGQIQYVWLFGIIGCFVLFLACINFMNLSTAQSEKRAKEVGIRKSIGSVRTQLIAQFLSESILVTLVSFLLATVVVALVIPYFNTLSNKQISVPLEDPRFWLFGIAFSLLVGLFAGSYPAFYLSSFRPIQVLKGTFKTGLSANALRKALVVFQFTVSIVLIIGTIIVQKQISHTIERPIGYDSEGIIMVEMSTDEHYTTYPMIYEELKQANAIQEMTLSSSPLTEVWNVRDGLSWDGIDPAFTPMFPVIWVSHDYGKTVDWELIAGRDFNKDLATDSTTMILNESAVKYMGIEDPIGKKIKWLNRDFEIIGVIKDLLIESPFNPTRQTIYTIDPKDMVNWMVFKLPKDQSMIRSIDAVEASFEKHLPNVPFEFSFVKDEHARKFDAIKRIGNLSSIFAVLAILISCLGLFGLASFMAQQRTKEIGIRKVLGASISDLWRLLSRDFLVLIAVSCIVAIPIAFVGVTSWLENYEYRTSLHWSVFALSCLGALLITMITISFELVKASVTNPVEALRDE